MTTESSHIIQLEKELAYYKKQVDVLSGSILSNQYAFTQLNNVCRKYINGFQIIAEIQRSFIFYPVKENLYEQFVDSIFSEMFLDRVIMLEIIPGKNALKPVLWKGFDARESLLLKNTALDVSDEFLLDKKPILLNSETIPNDYEALIKNSLFTTNFILTPLIKNQLVWGALFVGMQNEFNTISYIPLSISNINMFESLAGMISSMTQQLEQREVMEKERNRIARDMHDDLGSELSKIAVTSEHLKTRFSAQADVIKDLEIIKESTGSIVNNIGNIIWALNPINNTLGGLLGYLREYAYEYMEMHRLKIVFNVTEPPEGLIILHEARTHIFMVAKEALHNIVKHANANCVSIDISILLHTLCCSITDNGIGFKTNNQRPFGNGLRNMQQRITETGGSLVISSQPGKGTRLQFEVPL